jgi:hypothetical protein
MFQIAAPLTDFFPSPWAFLLPTTLILKADYVRGQPDIKLDIVGALFFLGYCDYTEPQK